MVKNFHVLINKVQGLFDGDYYDISIIDDETENTKESQTYKVNKCSDLIDIKDYYGLITDYGDLKKLYLWVNNSPRRNSPEICLAVKGEEIGCDQIAKILVLNGL